MGGIYFGLYVFFVYIFILFLVIIYTLKCCDRYFIPMIDSKCVEAYRVSDYGYNVLGNTGGGGVIFHTHILYGEVRKSI